MKDQFASALAIGLIAVAVTVGGILYMQRGAHVDLPGMITKVRTVSTGDNDALVLIDLRLTNPSSYPLVVHNTTVVLEKKNGDQFPQQLIARSDSQRLFDAMPGAGPFHPPLYTDVSIPAGSTGIYTLAAQYSAPERILQDRKRFFVQLDEWGGKSFEFSEK
jgi:hypothetical protein